MPWVYALHFQTVPWVHVILSSLQGRSTALSLWFKIAVNLTKRQFISSAKLRKLYFQPEGTLFLRIKFHYNEGKIICTPPACPCHFFLSAAKYIFSSWLFFKSSADKSGISLPNIACKWMQMSRMQSSPFQELVLLNILIHLWLLIWNIVFYTSCWRKTEAMIVPFTMLIINKRRGILEMTLPSHKRVSSKRLETVQPNQPKAVWWNNCGWSW